MVTPFLTHQVTTTGDFTQKIMRHTSRMVNQKLGPTYHLLPKPRAKPGTKRGIHRIGAGCLAEEPGRAKMWPMKIQATKQHDPAAVLKRLPTSHSSPPRCSARANQNRVPLFSPGQSPNRVISAERPARILGPTKCTSGKIALLQPGNLLILIPKNGPAWHEVSNG